MHGTEKTLSDLLHLHCGTASQIISGLGIASLNSRVFCSPGMGPNIAVLHVDDSNFASGLLISVNCQISYQLLKFKGLKSTFLLTFIEGWPLDFIFIVCVCLVM
jgi:hypothetical protein